jgi:hypothetical protein
VQEFQSVISCTRIRRFNHLFCDLLCRQKCTLHRRLAKSQKEEKQDMMKMMCKSYTNQTKCNLVCKLWLLCQMKMMCKNSQTNLVCKLWLVSQMLRQPKRDGSFPAVMYCLRPIDLFLRCILEAMKMTTIQKTLKNL